MMCPSLLSDHICQILVREQWFLLFFYEVSVKTLVFVEQTLFFSQKMSDCGNLCKKVIYT